jgi:hypothetical protein
MSACGEVARPTLRIRGLLGQAEPILTARGRAMEDIIDIFVGIDVAKVRNAIAIADGERGGEVRFLGEVDASEESMRRVVKRIAAKHSRVQFCYEAGPTGYGLHRLITSLGHSCIVVASSLVPRRPGDQVKTNRRDAISLAKLLRAASSASAASERLHAQARSYLPAQEGLDDAVPAMAAGTAIRSSRSSDRPAGNGRGGPTFEGKSGSAGADDRRVCAELVAGPDGARASSFAWK